jgi:hypothetical protein
MKISTHYFSFWNTQLKTKVCEKFNKNVKSYDFVLFIVIISEVPHDQQSKVYGA